MGSETTETSGTEVELFPIAEKVFLVPMELKHVPEVCEMEEICFPTPWNERMFTEELRDNPLSRYLLLVDRANPSRVVAYAGYWKVLDEGHITNIAVRPEWRRMGAATYLITQLKRFASAEGVNSMTLEVRVSNEGAQTLYKKMGFKPEGIRKAYYEDNREDALIMWYRAEEAEETKGD